MKELYEELIEVKFYHNPFKGYMDNCYLDTDRKNFVDKSKYKEEKIVCNSFDELWNYVSEKSIRCVSTKKNIFGRRYIALNLFCPYSIYIFENDKKDLDLFPITIIKYLGIEYSIKTVSQYLSASEFCDYLKEHGINSIVIN